MEKGHAGLAGKGSGEQRLTSAGRPHQQDAARRLGTETKIPIRLAQELDQFRNLALGVVLTGDIGELDHALVSALLLGRPAQELVGIDTASEATDGSRHAPPEEPIDADKNGPWQNGQQNLASTIRRSG